MAAQRIDVLAVMDARIREVEQDGVTRAVEMRAARAAVAELIDQVDRVQSALDADGRSPDAMTKQVAAKKLRAALCRVQGGQP